MAKTEYTYTRVCDGVFNIHCINHPERLNLDSEQIFLSEEIKAALPSAPFSYICSCSEFKITFNAALSSGDKAILDGIVDDHQNNA